MVYFVRFCQRTWFAFYIYDKNKTRPENKTRFDFDKNLLIHFFFDRNRIKIKKGKKRKT
jgi:hypothetical protein